jgi:hypothetical protein
MEKKPMAARTLGVNSATLGSHGGQPKAASRNRFFKTYISFE